jgi:hypothetical protein
VHNENTKRALTCSFIGCAVFVHGICTNSQIPGEKWSKKPRRKVFENPPAKSGRKKKGSAQYWRGDMLLQRRQARKSVINPELAEPSSAFLLSADGCMRRLEVPLDAHGRPFQYKSVGWRLFVQDALQLEFRNPDGSELPRVPSEEWTAKDVICLPNKNWDLTASSQDLPFLVVKIFQWPYIDWEHWNKELPFNKIAPLFTDSQYWRGDMLLVCYEILSPAEIGGPRVLKILSPAEVLAHIPAALSDFCHVDVESYKEMQLAFAMLTHQRLGTQACARALDDNVIRMVLDMAPKYTWDLRCLFHAMKKQEYFSDTSDAEDDEDDEEDEDDEVEEDEDGEDEL